VPLEDIDVADPWLYARDTIGAYFARLRRDARVRRK